jgi:hypothetical protein
MLGFHRDASLNSELSLDDFKRLAGPYLPSLDKILFCGVLGEPAAAHDLLDMIKHALEVNPGMTIGINTNGGLRSTAWWRELATLIKSNIKSYVVFSIDGLEDTNHIYRQRVSWQKLMENAAAYITAGGNAQWDSLIFDHNQHQIQGMRDLAKSMGFKLFRTKVSSRFKEDDPLKPPSGGKPDVVSKAFSCMAEDTNSIYLSAAGLWYPCCFIHQHDVLGGKEWGSAIKDSEDRHQAWDDLSQSLMSDDRPYICNRSCATTHNVGQWTHSEEFNV